MRNFLAVFFFFSSLVISFAQNQTISGTVTDAKQMPIPGVNIIIKNTATGTQTDFDGNYSLDNVANGQTLVFSYLGYKTTERVFSTNTTINVTLQDDLAVLDEVIVIGYGTQRKKEVTGAVAVIGAETIETLKPQQVEQALQGQISGVQITTGSGAPGSNLNIRIRGISTNGDNRPLILLDGNVIEDLSVISPSDIESINVLKDATAGIYGVRAANGVILITTKDGRKNSPFKVDFQSYFGVQETSRRIPVLNATEYALLTNEAFANGGQIPPFTNIPALGQGTNWQDEVFDTSPVYSVNTTISKGWEKSNISFGLSFLDQQGIVGKEKSGFERLNARVNYNQDFLKNFKFESSVIYSGTSRRSILENTIGSVLYNALNNAPTFTPRDENGDFTLAEGMGIEVINPLAQIENTFNRTQVDRLSGSFGLTYSFWENFSASSRFQANYAEVNGFNFTPIANFGNGKVFNAVRNAVTNFSNIFRDYTFDNYINYKNTFKENHTLDVTVGTSVFQTTGRFVTLTGFDLPEGIGDDADISLATADFQDNRDFGAGTFDARLLSYFARVQYNFKDKYLISGLIRRDGSTKFGPENKFGYFPSGSMGWIVSEEDFFTLKNTINQFKLRASYGIIGNDRIDDFGFTSLLNGEGVYVFDNTLNIGTAPGLLSNPEIRWEQQRTFNIGADLQFFDGDLDLTVDYFTRITEDLLLRPQVSGILGVTAPGSGPPLVNAGSVRNKGVEFAINYNKQVNDDFSFRIGYNTTILDNKVLSVNNDDGFIPGGLFGIGQNIEATRMEVGQPIGYFIGYKTDGVFQNQAEIDAHATQENASPGDLRFVDINGDGVIDTNDRTNIGDPIAEVTFGLNLSINYKNFDFQANAFGSVGNDLIRNYERFNPLTNRSVQFLDRWTGPGSTNSTPKVTTAANSNILFSDYFVEDASFLRMQNIQLGYSFNKFTDKKDWINNLYVYAALQNAFTLTRYTGFNPAANSGDAISGGFDNGFYPVPRTYMLGLNLKF